MNRLSSSILCGLFTLVAGYLGTTSSAQACSCLEPDITRNYAEADRVFRGQAIWSIEIGSRDYYLVRPLHAYKGCLDENNWTWISTENNSAGCGDNFTYGQEYLFFTDNQLGLSWSETTTSCHGNRLFSTLNEEEKGFLDTRFNCCGEECGCADGSEPFNCLVDPCSVATPCETDKQVTCVSNYCGGCNAEFVDEQGAILTCEPKESCELDRECAEDEYCGKQGQCVKDGSCTMDYECNLPGNTFDHDLRCVGYGYCNENRCEYQCGNGQCVNHEGFDFGDCEMMIGYVRVGDTCQSVSGCGSLIPGGSPAFGSRQDCEKACDLEPATFACGDALQCKLGSEYCLETIPGIVQESETEVQSNFDCMPFQLACPDVPSCEVCINGGPDGRYFDCEDKPNGAVQVTIPLP